MASTKRVPAGDGAGGPDPADGVPDELAGAVEVDTPSNWRFIDRSPTVDDVRKLLASLPDVYDVKAVDFLDYVLPLPHSEQVSVTRNGQRFKEPHEVVVLYMTVPGRIKMMQLAAEINGWRVDFEPEIGVPIPGFIELADNGGIYREYVVVRDSVDGRILGQKPGMSAFARGPSGIEKAETAARGRAIAAWGFGVLPGSGVASYEEMQSFSNGNGQTQRPKPEKGPKPTRGDLMQSVLTAVETLRQRRKADPAEQWQKIGDYIHKTWGLELWIEELGDDGSPVVTGIDWKQLNEGKLTLVLEQVRGILRSMDEREASV